MYRISIESTDGQEIIREEMRETECRGFVIIADREKDTNVFIHNVSNMDIAQAVMHNEPLLVASIIAKAMLEAEKMAETSSPLDRLLKSLKG